MQQNLSSEFKVLSRTTILRINEAHGAEPRRAERVTWLAFAFLQALAGRCACSLKGMHLQFKAHKLLTWYTNGRILVVHRWMVICDLASIFPYFPCSDNIYNTLLCHGTCMSHEPSNTIRSTIDFVSLASIYCDPEAWKTSLMGRLVEIDFWRRLEKVSRVPGGWLAYPLKGP
ncbi:hypothetical protein FOCG_06383 [Fusarium oxysporum f. sp. radicis-lycopersici 26381]|nr:hypothetical protein FOCG_06383 [Fusarium oxysporum f. sp. radicis-lycopersici 26381]